MPVRRLNFGDSLSGLLVDGVTDTPYVGATLHLTRDEGVKVEVPYLSARSVTQFAHVQTWFSAQTPPTNMLVLTPEGTVSLFDIAWSGHSENWGGTGASIGSVRPAVAVFGVRDGQLSAPLLLARMRSRLDGLNEWTRYSSVRSEYETDDESRTRSISMNLGRDPGITWLQGEASMTVQAGWFHAPEQDGYSRRTIVDDNVHIESTFSSGPKPFWDHFTEQRKVANLLVFLFGKPLSFREHKLQDDLFAARLMRGKIYDHPLTEVISRHTYQERLTEVPTSKELGRPIAHLAQIGAEGLESWSENYEAWARFILPSASVIGRTGRFIEDVVISTSMSIEAAGSILGECAGERVTWSRGRPTSATYAFRCLNALDVRWPGRLGDITSLSRAIANNYNAVKHYDRGDFPDHDESYIMSEVNQMIVRLLAVLVTGRGDEVLPYYRKSENFHEIRQLLDAYGLTIDERGRWRRDNDDGSPRSTPVSSPAAR